MGSNGRTLRTIAVKGYISGFDIANTVRMAHSQRKITFFLVEGDTDVRCLRRFVDPETCELLTCFGKSNALQATILLDESLEAGFVTLVDADFDRMLGTVPQSLNCVLTDAHDLNVMFGVCSIDARSC
jgi:hypothetical protein